MTSNEHPQKWDLPHDDPTVATKYAARSELAKGTGLEETRRSRAAARQFKGNVLRRHRLL